MTRKHYKAIAEALRNYGQANRPEDRLSWNDLLDDLCAVLKHDNPNFSADKFREACGG